MNRQTPARTPAQPLPSNYRSSQQQPPNPSSSMYYATAGQQATQQGQRASNGTAPAGPPSGGATAPGFPPLAVGRGAPPGFGSRGSDSSDFPALGAMPNASTYASQAQTQQAATSSSQHLPQQLYMQGGTGLAPPPPPGIGASPGSQPNGLAGESLRGEDFPALGAPGDRERTGYLRSAQQPPSPSLVNGASTSQSTSATPSTNPPLPSGGMDSWQRHSPNRNEPIMRPVQQILSSPVDKWGLKALLYEIKMGIGKDRGRLLFGEELSELGVDLDQSDPLFTTFATPWIDQSSLPRHNITEPFVIPSCYHFVAPPVEAKIQNFSEETLFYAFYMCTGDLLQLEAAEELFTRGWRYHMEMQAWLTSPTLPSVPLDTQGPNWIRGPFHIWDPRLFSRQKTNDDFMLDTAQLEATRPAGQILAEERAKKDAAKSPNGSLGASHNSSGYGSHASR